MSQRITRSEGYEPGWDLNLAEGNSGEEMVADALGLTSCKVEVKRKSYRDFMFYVETAHSPGATGVYVPSGINTTESDHWAYVIENTGIIVLIPADRLKIAACQASHAAERDGDCPTRGRLVGEAQLFDGK